MSTRKQLIDALATHHAACPLKGPRKKWSSRPTLALVISFALVLPAAAAVLDAFGLRSLAVFLVGLVLLTGFGVPYYVLLRWFLKEDGREQDSAALASGKIVHGQCLSASEKTPEFLSRVALVRPATLPSGLGQRFAHSFYMARHANLSR